MEPPVIMKAKVNKDKRIKMEVTRDMVDLKE